MIHDAFIAHLQGAGLTAPVRYAFTMEPVDSYEDDLPALMVYPEGDAFGDNSTDNIVTQSQVTTISVFVVCKLATLDTHVEEFRAAAQGWRPGSNWDAMELSGGAVVDLRGEYIWWRESVTVQRSVRQTL